MKRPCDCILGVREANTGSGVGLFNRLLAERLGIPYVLLAPRRAVGGHPLVSLKFEELSPPQQSHLVDLLGLRTGSRTFSLFLHTFAHSPIEQAAVLRACHVFCGNDAIVRKVREIRPSQAVTAAFAPSLICETYRTACRPADVEFFYFGMATKIDKGRFLRLRDLLAQIGVEYRVLCSLAVHQTSDGTCLNLARQFLSECFGPRLVFLGTLEDMGIAYFLHRPTIFVGFYKGGVRSNNTTFNTALRYNKRIVTNLDADSPPEVQSSPRILNIDRAEAADLERFLRQDCAPEADRLAELFTWEELLARIRSAWDIPQSKVA